MNRKKLSVRWLLILAAVSTVLLGNLWLQAGETSPAKDHIIVGGRDLIMADEGDSIAGNIKSPAGKAAKKDLKSFLGLGAKTINLAFTCTGDKVLFDKIIPAFQAYWLAKTGEEVNFVTGYALPDLDKLATSVSGEPVQVLIMSSSTNVKTRDYSDTKWQKTANKGVVLSYPQVFLVPKGNPKMIKSYTDLTIPGIRVIHINPLQGTGGGMWQVFGIYGSALKETELATGNKDYDVAMERLKKTEEQAFYNVVKTGDAVKHMLQGDGDVVIASEWAALNAVKKNDSIEIVLPAYTVFTDLAVYTMDKNISRGEQSVVDEFIDFLFLEQSQEYIAQYGFRPSDPNVLAKHPEFGELDNPFHLDYLGEQTALKKNLILGKWLTIHNNRPGRTKDDVVSP